MADVRLNSLTFPDLPDRYVIKDYDADIAQIFEDVYNLYPRKSLASAPIHAFSDGADGIPVKAMEVDVSAVQSGSGDPSPDNVRPISGWSEAKIVGNGINQWDEEWELGYYDNVTGAALPSTTQIRSKSTAPIPVVGGQTYACVAGSQRVSQTFWYDKNDNFISNISNASANPFIVTAPANACYLRFNMPSAYGTTYADNVSINFPSTETAYHTYNGSLVTIAFGSTVYGGTLTYKGGLEWEFTATHAIVDLGDLSWTYKTSGSVHVPYFEAPFSGIKCNGRPVDVAIPAICSAYPVVTRAQGDFADNTLCGDGSQTEIQYINVKNSAYTDAPTFTTAMEGVKLVYELATPLAPITLTADAECVTQYGDNTLFADCGDSTLTYRQDIGLVIGG